MEVTTGGAVGEGAGGPMTRFLSLLSPLPPPIPVPTVGGPQLPLAPAITTSDADGDSSSDTDCSEDEVEMVRGPGVDTPASGGAGVGGAAAGGAGGGEAVAAAAAKSGMKRKAPNRRSTYASICVTFPWVANTKENEEKFVRTGEIWCSDCKKFLSVAESGGNLVKHAGRKKYVGTRRSNAPQPTLSSHVRSASCTSSAATSSRTRRW